MAVTGRGYGQVLSRNRTMAETFRRFIEAEIEEILNSMDDDCRLDPQRCSCAAMEWISHHAKAFREEWERKHAR